MAKERKKHYRLKPFPIALMLAAVLLGCIALTIAISNQIMPPDMLPVGGEPSSPSSEEQVPSSEPEMLDPTYVRLMSVGDNLIHPAIYNQAGKRANGEGYDFDYAYANVQSILDLADIRTINQETVMVEGKPLSGYPTFNSPTALGSYLADTMKFDVVNLANNHCLDMGTSGLSSTLDFWGTLPNVQTVGVYKDADDFVQQRIIERNGITIAFLGMTEQTNGLSLSGDSSIVIAATTNEEQVQSMIQSAKSLADIVVVNAHWGNEYTTDPAPETQVALSKKMVNWGADIIIGHHPHVIQPIEFITREDGTQGVVAYSLGNFISAQEKGWRMIGGILDVTMKKDYTDNSVQLDAVRFIPTITHYEGNASNVRIYPLTDYTEDLAKSHGVRANTSQFSLEWINQCVEEVISQQYLTPLQ